MARYKGLNVISALHTAKLVESEKKNGKGGTANRPEIIPYYNKFM
jgi:hypothetical protein